MPRIPAMTTGMRDFMTTAGFQMAMLLMPVPALDVPKAAPRSTFQYAYLLAPGPG